MPNWVNCSLTFPTNKEVESFMNKNKEGLFQAVDPMPVELSATDIDWLYWRNQNWGSKWDADIYVISDNHMEFATANSPAIAALTSLSALFPDVEFQLKYSEPGNAFCGIADFFNGEYELAEYDFFSQEGMEEINFHLSCDEDDYEFDEETNCYMYKEI